MNTGTNGPPIVEYEKIVNPVAIAMKNAALSKREKRDDYKSRAKTKHHPKKTHEEDDDKLFEPYLGKLVDLSA